MNKHIDLEAALATPDSDVAAPSYQHHAGSFISQLCGLELGASAAKVREVGHLTNAELVHNGKSIRDDIRNAMMSSIRAAQRRTGSTYAVEVFNTISPRGRTYVIAVVQRLS